MNTLRQGSELVVRVLNSQGGLDSVIALLARHGISISARSFSYEKDRTAIMLVTDDPDQAQAVLTAQCYECKLEDVLWIRYPQYAPGSVARLCTRLLNAGIGIERTYVSTYNSVGCCVVLKTSDNPTALRLLAPSQPAGPLAPSLLPPPVDHRVHL